MNWTRTGFLRILRRMRGIVLGDLEDETGELAADEPVSDLDVAHGALEGTVVEPEEVPLAIDELPLVALLGCFAEGETVVRGAQELRVKESDRIAGVVEACAASAPTSRPPRTASRCVARAACAAGRSTPAATIASR